MKYGGAYIASAYKTTSLPLIYSKRSFNIYVGKRVEDINNM